MAVIPLMNDYWGGRVVCVDKEAENNPTSPLKDMVVEQHVG